MYFSNKLTLNDLEDTFVWTVTKDEEIKDIFRAAFVTKGARKGELKKSLPFHWKQDYSMKGLFQGKANYIWRFLCFSFPVKSADSCVPVLVDSYIPRNPNKELKEGYRERDAIQEELKDWELKFTGHLVGNGTLEWGRALGYL